MSALRDELRGFAIQKGDEELLRRLESLKLYAAIKTPSHIVLMAAGMLDNSCGFIHAKRTPTPESLGHLFHVKVLEPLGDNLYFYLSN